LTTEYLDDVLIKLTHHSSVIEGNTITFFKLERHGLNAARRPNGKLKLPLKSVKSKISV